LPPLVDEIAMRPQTKVKKSAEKVKKQMDQAGKWIRKNEILGCSNPRRQVRKCGVLESPPSI